MLMLMSMLALLMICGSRCVHRALYVLQPHHELFICLSTAILGVTSRITTIGVARSRQQWQDLGAAALLGLRISALTSV